MCQSEGMFLSLFNVSLHILVQCFTSEESQSHFNFLLPFRELSKKLILMSHWTVKAAGAHIEVGRTSGQLEMLLLYPDLDEILFWCCGWIVY